MNRYRIQIRASDRLDEIFHFTADTWGEDQATAYIGGMFARFAAIADHSIPWRAIPAAFGIDGYVCRYERHFIYWKLLDDGSVGIVTILHERMHQIECFRDDFEGTE